MMASSFSRPTRAIVALLFSAALSRAGAATLNWVNPAGGNSGVAANWSPAKVPAAGDILVVDATGTYTVTINQSVSVAGITVAGNGGTPTVRIPSGITLTLTGAGTVASNAVVALDSGVIAGSGELLCDGGFTWTGGNLTGNGQLTISPLGKLRITGAQPHYLINRRLVNRGTTIHDGSNHLFVRSAVGTPGVFENLGSYELAGALLVQSDLGGGSFLNSGTLRRTAPGTIGGVSVAVVNGGTVDVQQGRMNFAGGLANTGAIQIAANAELDLANGTVSLDAGTAITGTGRWLMDATVDINVPLTVDTPIRVTAGTVKLNAPLTTTGAFEQTGGNLVLKNGLSQVLPNYDLTSGQLSGDGSTLTVTGTMTWGGGNLQGVDGTGRVIIPPGANLKITGVQPHYLINRRLVNHGTTIHDGSNHLFVRSNGAGLGFFENRGTYELAGALLIQSDLGGGRFANFGTFRRTAAGLIGGISIPVENNGFVDVKKGRLNFAGGLTNIGHLNVESGAELDLAGGNCLLTTGTTLTGTGRWLLDANVELLSPLDVATPILVTAGTFRVKAPLTTTAVFEQTAGTVELGNGLTLMLPDYRLSGGAVQGDNSTLRIEGKMTWSGGNLSGVNGTGEVVIPASSNLRITGVQPHYLINRRLVIEGSALHDGSNHLFVRSSAAGQGVIENKGTYELAAALLVQSDLGGGRFVNTGTLRRSATGVLGGISIAVENSGTIEAIQGRFNFAGGLANTGPIQVAAAGEVDFANGDFAMDAGSAVQGTGRWVMDANVNLNVPLTIETPIFLSAGNLRVNKAFSTTAAFEQTGGNLVLGNGIQQTLPSYKLSAGQVLGDGSTLTITGSMNWSGGNLAGTDGTGLVIITPGASLKVTGAQPHYVISRRLVNQGTAVHDGSNHLFVRAVPPGPGWSKTSERTNSRPSCWCSPILGAGPS